MPDGDRPVPACGEDPLDTGVDAVRLVADQDLGAQGEELVQVGEGGGGSSRSSVCVSASATGGDARSRERPSATRSTPRTFRGGDWRVANEASDGVLLRVDLHRLLDRGVAEIRGGTFAIVDAAHAGEYAEFDGTPILP